MKHTIDGKDFIFLCNQAGLDGKDLWAEIWKHFKDKQEANKDLNRRMQEAIKQMEVGHDHQTKAPG